MDKSKEIKYFEGEMNALNNSDKKEIDITCPFCGATGFDKIGLKDHLEFHCEEYIRTESL